MKSKIDLDAFLNNLYWLVEHGKTSECVYQLDQLQQDAYKAGMTEAASLCCCAPGANIFKQKIITARDKPAVPTPA